MHYFSVCFGTSTSCPFSSSALHYCEIRQFPQNQPYRFCNFVFQDRVTDHRVGYNVSSVERVLNAESLDPIIDALTIADEQERLEFFLDSLDLKRKVAESIKKK